MMLRRVLKRLPKGGGECLEPGTVVDVSGWRNLRTLEANRFVTDASEADAASFLGAAKPKVTKPKSAGKTTAKTSDSTLENAS